MPFSPSPGNQQHKCALWMTALLGFTSCATSASAEAGFCAPRSWAAPEQLPPGSDLTAADYEWTAESKNQRTADDLRSIQYRREMRAVRQAAWVVRRGYYSMSLSRQGLGDTDEYDIRQVQYSTVAGHARGMAFRNEYGRRMSSLHCFHNWNLVSDQRLEVDVLRRPVRLHPWSDLIRMHFVRQGKDWKFDNVEWLNRRIEPPADGG